MSTSYLALDHDAQKSIFEPLFLLHANAVYLVMEGTYIGALQQFREVTQALQTMNFDAEEDVPKEESNRRASRDENILRVFSVDVENVPQVFSTDGSRLAPPFAVLIPQDHYEDLSVDDCTLFAMTALYNIGLCYQIMSHTGGRTYRKRAQSIYEVVFQLLNSMKVVNAAHDDSSVKLSVVALGVMICNNMAALHADLGDRDSLSDCLSVLEQYLFQIDVSTMDCMWVHYNLFDWLSFQSRHAAVA